jgi:pantoate--beta-alanine ligase
MRRTTTADEVRAASRAARAGGASVGFVPTMGYLHAGHLSLVAAARAACDHVVVSIFVNPAQFGPGMDLDRYPRDLEGDAAKLAAAGADVLYAPDASAVYPPGYATWVEVEGLTAELDGASRPGYFRGVCTVVAKLFHAVEPDVAFFGQKDVQQAFTVRRMARDLEMPVDVRIHPTVRAEDGLALSSRNAYLDAEGRAVAPALYRALSAARARFATGERDAAELRAAALAVLEREPTLALDYLEVVALETMRRVERAEGPACIAAACDLGGTRLIDNVLLVEDEAAFLAG